jgi:RNA polymerase sigma-70 factor (ECF subfamily)
VDASRETLRAAAGSNDDLADLLDPLATTAATGDRDALELLVWAVDELELAEPPLRGLLVNRSDLEDVSQDVLIAVAETIGAYRGESRFRTWLNQVARYKAIAHLRRKRDESTLDDATAEESPSDAMRISSLLATRQTLHDVLANLPDHYQQAVFLRDVKQLPYEDVAERLGIGEPGARSRVARGRALVAARLATGTGT